MAVSKCILSDAPKAGADLSGNLYHLVKLNSSGEAILAGDGEAVYGAISEAATQGQPTTVDLLGIAKVIFGGTVATGAQAACDANGKAVTAASGDVSIGYVRKGGIADEIGEILLNQPFNAA